MSFDYLFVNATVDGSEVVEALNKRVAEAADDGRPVFYTHDYAPIELPADDPENQAALHPGLEVRGPVLEKGPGKRGYFSGVVLAPEQGPQAGPAHGSLGPLVGALSRSGARELTVVGIAVDVCVGATARDAVRLGYSATVPLGATAFVHAHPDGDRAAVTELRTAGVTVID